jgi:hypothetical protein
MTFYPLSAPADFEDEEFYAIIERLKDQKALPRDSFIRDIPFFTFSQISKESQIKELFQASNLYRNAIKALLQNVLPLPENAEEDSISMTHVMNFAQVCLYKVLPCPDPNCIHRPREIVTHNQYKDIEYQCPFYHHDRDQRRIVITSTVNEEFAYKANYYEDGRSNAEKDKYSQNYFESMFHPLYYKMFRCKREYCNACQYCPFYHYEQEKKSWDKMFSNFLMKDRITYVKDKQKYYESTSHTGSENREQKSSGDISPIKNYGPNNERQQYQRNQRGNNRYHKSPKNPNEARGGKGNNFSNKKNGDFHNNVEAWRKDSRDYFGLNTRSFETYDQTAFRAN